MAAHHASAELAKVRHAADQIEPLALGSSGRDVLDALSRMVERAGLGIGDRLPPEIELAERLGIGRAKVREALIAWQNMGIVTRNKKAGTILAAEVSTNAIQIPLTLKLEAESLLRTLAVRRPLEIEAVRLAARHGHARQGKVIMARAAALMASFEAGEDWRQADNLFHAAIHEASGNPLFSQLIRQIQRTFNEIYEAPFGEPALGSATIPMHPGLAEAVAAHDEARAAGIMTAILDRVADDVRNTIRKRCHG
ncbi:MAG: FadR family transcriptional regulator [Rhizobiales bacterium]|nr:FadR family transcriptional regulator [Hyphomicrobiales bacterium]